MRLANRTCNLTSVAPTLIVCTSPVLSDLNITATNLTLTVNGRTTVKEGVVVITQEKRVLLLEPSSVGTTGKQTLSIYISGYSEAQPKEKWAVQLKDSRRMNVVNASYDAANEVVKLQVKYPGVEQQGLYEVQVEHTDD